MSTLIGVLCMAALCGDPTCGIEAQDSLEQLLRDCRTALACDNAELDSGARLSGTGSIWGEAATVELLHAPAERFLLDARGKFSLAYALGAEGGWEQDSSGAIWKLDLSPLEKKRWFFSGLSGQWLQPSSGIECSLVDTGEANAGSLRLRLHRKGGVLDATIELDRESFVPRTLVIEDPSGPTTIEFSRWSEGPGRRWPRRTLVRESSGSEIELVFDRIGALPDRASERFEQPSWQVADARFTKDVPASVECRQSRLGFVFVHPRIDGQDVGWFFLDSGAGSWSLDRDVVKRLELESFGRRGLTTLDRTQAVGSVRAKSFELGPLTVENPLFIELDLTYLEQPLGFKPAGIVGADLLRRCVMQVDLSLPEVTLHDPETFEQQDIAWAPFRFDGRLACVEATLEGDRRGLFVIDTGMQMSVVFNAPYVRAMNLLEGRATKSFTFHGVDSNHEGRTGRLSWLTLAGRRFESVEAQFADTARGALARSTTSGIIGVRILGASRLVFDYSHSRIAFVAKH